MLAWVILVSAALCYAITLTVSILGIRLRVTGWHFFMVRPFRVQPIAQDTIVGGLPDAAFLLNQYHAIVAANDAAARLAASTDFAGQPLAHALPHIPSIHVHCAAMEMIRFEAVCNNPEHTLYEATLTPLFDQHGSITGRLLILRDITDQRLMQSREHVLVEVGALLSSPHVELPLSDVAQLAAEYLVDTCAIYLQDPDGQMRIFGASSHPAATLPFGSEEALSFAHVGQAVMDGSKLVFTEANRGELHAGGFTEAAQSMSQLRSLICVPLQSQEQTYGALLFATAAGGRLLDASDITFAEAIAQRIAGAVASQRLFAALRASEAHFRAASKAAEQVSTAKSTFLTMMSHEIRTPLMGVLGIADLLGRTNVQNDQHELLNILIRNAHSLRTTITDILDISKIEAGKLDLVKEPVDLLQCIEDAVSTVAFQASEKGLDLTYHIDTDVPGVVSTDYVRLRQILMNLLSNAVKFTDHGTVTVHVMSTDFSGDSFGTEHIRFSVQDSGIGIAPEHCAHLFDAFYQGTQQTYGGSGIGLTISKQLCELMGGTIEVVSQPGEGSTFSFTIAAEPLAAIRSKMPPGTVSLLDGKYMLLVGMSDAELAMLAPQARAWGMHVRTMTTSAEALCALRSGARQDVIVAGRSIVEDAPQTITDIHQLAAVEPEQPIITLLPLTHVWNEAFAVPDNMVVQTCPLKLSAFYETLVRLVQPSAGSFTITSVAPVAVPQAPLRMLIVDDNETNCMLMEHMLGTSGYRADVVTSGEAALRAVRRSAYDVVWLDVHLAGGTLDGLEVAQQLATMQNVSVPYIVAVTGSATLQDREQCLAAGMHDYLCKPVEQDQLEGVIARACAWLSEAAMPEPLYSAYYAADPEEQGFSGEHPDSNVASEAPVKTPAGYMLPEAIVVTFFEEASEMLLDMRCAMDIGDSERLYATLHRLKSSSWYVAGESMMRACQVFEDLVRLGDRMHWEEAMCELEESLAHAYEAMNDMDTVGTSYWREHSVVPYAQEFALISGD
jgi:signal transduction histidine kinase/CheY-like chemotaxis protein